MAIDRIPGVGPQNSDIAAAVAAPSAATIAAAVAAPTRAQIQSDIQTYSPAQATFDLLGSNTGTSAVGSFAITSLSSSYRFLRVIVIGLQVSSPGQIFLRLNNDSIDGYANLGWDTDGTSTRPQGFSEYGTTRYNFQNQGDQGTGSSFALTSIIDIHDYASTSARGKYFETWSSYVRTTDSRRVFQTTKGFYRPSAAAAINQVNFVGNTINIFHTNDAISGTYVYGAK